MKKSSSAALNVIAIFAIAACADSNYTMFPDTPPQWWNRQPIEPIRTGPHWSAKEIDKMIELLHNRK